MFQLNRNFVPFSTIYVLCLVQPIKRIWILSSLQSYLTLSHSHLFFAISQISLQIDRYIRIESIAIANYSITVEKKNHCYFGMLMNCELNRFESLFKSSTSFYCCEHSHYKRWMNTDMNMKFRILANDNENISKAFHYWINYSHSLYSISWCHAASINGIWMENSTNWQPSNEQQCLVYILIKDSFFAFPYSQKNLFWILLSNTRKKILSHDFNSR